MIAPDNISSDSLVKSVPANLEAERAVLGSLLIDPDALIKVANFLRAEDFYRERHGWIYEAMLALNERREPIDFVTLQDELERREQLSEIGGPAYISDLSTSTPTSIYVDHYARIVERTALLRRLIAGAGKIVELAYDESQDANQVLERAEQIIFGISESRVHRDLTPIHSVMQDVINRLDFLSRNQDTLMGVSTGFHAMDKLLGGFQQSDLIIVAARPGMGKSSLALSVAQKAAQNLNARVAIFSLEMSSEQLVQRLLAMETRIDSHRLRLGQIY
ncbi:MAG: AAA family ATPase, partial [Caldilineaceae bacterium]|nr:AAA family ATPase [Caldilineaceae bacterium]